MPSHLPLIIAIYSVGTFTDCVWLENSALRILKVFSTPADPSQAIAEAVAMIAPAHAETIVLHGTTVGTNTLLQRKGARVAFVTTAGFEDSIEIGRQHRPKLYDFFFERIQPLVEASLRFGVNERTSPVGKVLQAAGPAELRELASAVGKSKAEAVAVS